MNKEFVTRSNYLVAFLAVVIGLSVYKESIEHVTFTVLNTQTNLASASIPMICAILLSTYAAALSHFSSNVTFTSFPLSKILRYFSNIIAILGLLYPLGLGMVFVTQEVLKLIIVNPKVIETLQIVISIVGVIIGYRIAGKASSSYEKYKTLTEKEQILNSTLRKSEITTRKEDRESVAFHFYREYEYLRNLMIKYLQLNGYGINAQSSVTKLVKILQEKNLFNKEDLKTAEDLHDIRNMYPHSLEGVSNLQLKEAEKKAKVLQEKIRTSLSKQGTEIIE